MINTSTSDENLCGLKRADFQTTVNGKQTDLFILKNENGAEIAVTNYGGAVLAIMVPDKNGKYANVIQGHDSITHVINSHETFPQYSYRSLREPYSRRQIHFRRERIFTDYQQWSQLAAWRSYRISYPHLGCRTGNSPKFEIALFICMMAKKDFREIWIFT